MGNDVLTGGSGRDAFVFDTKPNKKRNVDKITDFNVKNDSSSSTTRSSRSSARERRTSRKLNKNYFSSRQGAKDKNDYVIYNKKNGIVYYDEDGSGSKKAVEIVRLDKNLKLTYNDFFVI